MEASTSPAAKGTDAPHMRPSAWPGPCSTPPIQPRQRSRQRREKHPPTDAITCPDRGDGNPGHVFPARFSLAPPPLRGSPPHMRGGEPGEGYDKGATHQDAWRAPQHRQLPTDAHGLKASLRKGAGETRAEGLPFRQPLGYAPRTPPRRTPGVQPRPPTRPRREEGRHSLRRAYAAPPRSVPKLTHDVALAPAPSPHARKRARGGVSRVARTAGRVNKDYPV